MANNKRKPISFPELDQMEPRTEPRGRRAILRSAEEVEAEEQMLDIQNAGIPAFQETSIRENKDAGIHALQQSDEAVSQHPSIPEIQKTSIPANMKTANIPEAYEADIIEASNKNTEGELPSNRTHYTKVTYRLSPDAIEAIEEAKRLLRRKYKLKASLEEIAEEAILALCDELLENQDASILVNKIASKQAKQKAGVRQRQ